MYRKLYERKRDTEVKKGRVKLGKEGGGEGQVKRTGETRDKKPREKRSRKGVEKTKKLKGKET